MNQIIGHVLTSLSIVVAVFFSIWGYIHNRIVNRQRYTVEFIGNLKLCERLAEADFQMTRLINSEKRLVGNDIEDEVDRFVIILLDYYEFMSTSYYQKTMDRNVIHHLRGGPMSRAFEVCEKYINDRRVSLNAPNLYRNYEKLVLEYQKRNLGL